MSYDIHVYPIELKEKTISENMNLDDVFEMSMTAGEFTYLGNLKGKFGVFDPSNKGWQK